MTGIRIVPRLAPQGNEILRLRAAAVWLTICYAALPSEVH